MEDLMNEKWLLKSTYQYVVYLLRAYCVQGVSLGPGSTVVNLTDNSLLSQSLDKGQKAC